MRRILIGAAILIGAVAIVGLGIWLKSGTGVTPADNTAPVPPGTLPLPSSNGQAATGGGQDAGSGETSSAGSLPTAGIIGVSQTAILDYAVNASGTLLMFTPAGTLVQLTNSESVLLQGGFDSVSGGWFSPDGRWLLVKSGSASVTRWSLLDIPKRVWKDIPANTGEMYWSPTGNLLAYFARRSDGSTLTIFDPQKGTTRSVLALAALDMTLRWKDTAHILIMDRPSALVSGNVWDVNTANGSMSVFALNVAGADVRWGGSRQQGLLFKADAQGGTLALVDGSGTASVNTAFLTLPSKCVFGDVATATTSAVIGDYLFCALPQEPNPMRTRVLPDEYLKRQFGTNDLWYAANTLSGTLKPLLPDTQKFTFEAINPKIYDVSLYFMNRNDQKLYRISLEEMAKI